MLLDIAPPVIMSVQPGPVMPPPPPYTFPVAIPARVLLHMPAPHASSANAAACASATPAAMCAVAPVVASKAMKQQFRKWKPPSSALLVEPPLPEPFVTELQTHYALLQEKHRMTKQCEQQQELLTQMQKQTPQQPSQQAQLQSQQPQPQEHASHTAAPSSESSTCSTLTRGSSAPPSPASSALASSVAGSDRHVASGSSSDNPFVPVVVGSIHLPSPEHAAGAAAGAVCAHSSSSSGLSSRRNSVDGIVSSLEPKLRADAGQFLQQLLAHHGAQLGQHWRRAQTQQQQQQQQQQQADSGTTKQQYSTPPTRTGAPQPSSSRT